MWNDNIPPLSCHGKITLSKIDQIYPIAIQNQISTRAMHILSLVKIRWDLLKLLPWNETMDVSRTDNSVKTVQNLPISTSEPIFQNINTHTKIGENPLILSQVIVWKWRYWRVVGIYARNYVKNWRTFPISNPKPNLYNINTHTRFVENSSIFIQGFVKETKNQTCSLQITVKN